MHDPQKQEKPNDGSQTFHSCPTSVDLLSIRGLYERIVHNTDTIVSISSTQAYS